LESQRELDEAIERHKEGVTKQGSDSARSDSAKQWGGYYKVTEATETV